MKKWSLLALVAAALVISLPVAADGTSFEAQLEPLQLMGLETPPWMSAGLGPIQTSFDCSTLNNSGCRYIYNISSMCCVAYRPDPGTFCPPVCL